ncbi:MAG: phage tail protein, partial [Oscillospiraceae bacterium]
MYSPSKCVIQGGELFTPGDAFEEYLPQIYQSDGFFRNYMSIISSMYLDLERKIEEYPKILDIETTDAEMLPVLAGWIGLGDICKFVSGETLRNFLREGFWLNRNRGTIPCISRVVELFTGNKPTIVERYRFFKEPTPYSKIFSKIYGSDNDCFTVILFCPLGIEDCPRLKYLVELFAPAKTTVRILLAQDMIFLDSGIYLDKNARLVGPADGILGEKQKMDTNAVLI